MRWSLLILVVMGCGLTREPPSDAGPLVCGRCTRYGAVTNAGVVNIAELNEASGVATSHAHPGVLYVHNDSGGRPVIYITNTTGADLGELVLDGANNVDWEDVALGPCASGSCLYIGEIGDNSRINVAPYAVYRVAEPTTVSATKSVGSMSVPFERLALRYPNDEKHNAETMMVHPVTGDVYVVTKVDPGQKSSVYKATAPLTTSRPNDLVKLGTLNVPDGFDLQITAGDIDVCGTTVLIRSYTAMYQYTLDVGASFDSIFDNTFTRVPAPAWPSVEPQGEAVTWASGGGYYTVSEGAQPMLHFVGCAE